MGIASVTRRGWITRPLATYGVLELLVGLSCVAFTYGFHPLSAHLVQFQNLDDSALQKFAVRFAFGAILIVPSAALMGASFRCSVRRCGPASRPSVYTINTDHNRWIEYATPRYNWTDDDGGAANLPWLKTFADPSPVAVR